MRPGPARLTVLSAIVVASIAGHAAAQPLYRWVDEKGVVHYSQFPPPAPAEPPTPAPEAKPSPPPEAKPAPAPQAKPSPAPEAEQKLVDVIRRTFVGVFPSALFEKELIEVYAKHFNEAEAEELLRFYRTPVGTKAIQLSAVLAGEGAVIGQRLAKSREAEFAQRLREELARECSPEYSSLLGHSVVRR